MQMFLDSAKVDEIRHALEVWDIDGLTTNPRHVRDSGKAFHRVIEEIAELFGSTDKPVSVEVNPHLTDWEEIVEEGLKLSKISDNFVIKVGASETGFQALRELSNRGIKTNATMIFSTAQAWHAARAGANYVSPFIGWKEAAGEDVSSFIPEVSLMLENYGYPTQIIAAGMRNARQIASAAVSGAHCVTAAFALYQESFRNPFTDMCNDVFQAAWDATPRD